MSKSANYRLPSYAKGLLASLRWDLAIPMPEMNGYRGLVRDSFHRFHNIPGFPAGVFYYECKFAIDGDGSDPGLPGDTYQSGTALTTSTGRALSSRHYPFAVIPLVRPGHRLPSFHHLGIELGDVGTAFWKGRRGGYAYGDSGPRWERIGEGSRYLASRLHINPNPVTGGIDTPQIPPGIIHICFAGTSDVKDSTDPHTSRTAREVERLATERLDRFLQRTRG